MASETEAPEISSLFERLLRHRDLYLFLPFVLGFSSNNSNNNVSRENPEDPDQESPLETTSQRERIILINPFTQGMVVIDGASNLEALLRSWVNKDGQPPASKTSIEAMPSVEIGESEDGECVVCLEEWRPGEVAKEMPCKHKFHGECIEKWLGIHGSCPICRYNMPVDEQEMGNKRDEERRRFGREVWVSFSFNSDRRSGDSNQVPSTDSNDVSSLSPRPDDHEMEG
ncbi:E3 ubiquitin-protein ligase RNF181-like [Herrania umbratica]|uniref:RING-type E3 ubiquitin transferase n=1 Tax=Herrania umbratica TaxID=108875 RepID=A0A6J1BJ90_9ROSI|nr:E3 ubiquitin-protein ligase RNF181-like [Herrania umbratica]